MFFVKNSGEYRPDHGVGRTDHLMFFIKKRSKVGYKNCGEYRPDHGVGRTDHLMFIIKKVENIGFEPITSSLPAKRSSQMS
jgi:hypothetical protein